MKKLNSPWRTISTAVYGAPNEGKIYGILEVDVTDAWEMIMANRAEGRRITMTHLVTGAIGRTIGWDIPEMNAFVKRGQVVQRDEVIVTVAVNMHGGKEMSSVKIYDAHKMTVFEIAEKIRSRAAKARSGDDNATMENKSFMAKIPWPFRRMVFLLFRFITNSLGFQIKSLGLGHNAFGSILLSNIGSHGLSMGFAALFPGSKLPAVIIMGKEEDKAVVRDGKIVIRKILPLTGTFDHRVMDGYHGGMLAHHIKRYLEHAELLAEAPVELKEETVKG
ncbi:MAG: dehydrogenase [Candidatus Marinimicrobia bacterium]|jgi:pyruvate dehydrogenase E2 component (dihydrolipoamide acetyltransferase)|nr:dehydrogenase [Candidatus Neomarinimicrobiota bacterium]MBT3632513.1 dehydrogenase [Candidatus Neomarinimicrobiota bacterium]MBT3824912.1 dehydrogenase [Candidatus Neomarinimicrobiota bacterium]MBT4132781.1 dehydrogenase [Candidatus Neomarinimicrobiota bacterium]MBT4295297.1 dehydrogenase [Candidatus Neomarinimicrobiota bacterium]